MTETQQAGQGYPRGRNVGLWLPPEDYERLQQWGATRHRKVANAARKIILDRLAADELAEHAAEHDADDEAGQ